VRAATEVCEPQLAERQQPLQQSLAARRTAVLGDFERLRQAVWNLLQNASKFSPPGSTIWLRTADTTDGRVSLAVQDQGMGIDPAARERIFDAFAQADRRITREFGGLGLGLAIVRGCVQAHGGSVRVFSEGAGHGASFEIELPAAKPATPLEDPP